MNGNYLTYGLPGSPGVGAYYNPLNLAGDLSYTTALGSFGAPAAMPAQNPVPPPPVPAVPAPMVSTMSAPGTSLAPATSLRPQTASYHPDTGAQGLFGGAFKEGGMFQDEILPTLGGLKDLTSIIGGFGALWNGIQANKLAKEAFSFQKKAYERNYSNQVDSYNTALEDRIRARYAQSNGSSADAEAYIQNHRLGG